MFTLSISLPCVVGNKNLISCRIWTKPREKGERWEWEGERKAMNLAIIPSEMFWCFLLQCFYLRNLIQVNHQIKYLIVLIFIRQIKRPIWCKFPYFINVTQTRTVRNFNRIIFSWCIYFVLCISDIFMIFPVQIVINHDNNDV